MSQIQVIMSVRHDISHITTSVYHVIGSDVRLRDYRNTEITELPTVVTLYSQSHYSGYFTLRAIMNSIFFRCWDTMKEIRIETLKRRCRC
jgi:hypothetical protein